MASRAQWEQRVAQWRRSGLTAEAFATQQGLNVHTLRGWSSALQRPAARVVNAGFARLIAVDTASARPVEPGAIDVVLASGRVVRVRQGFDPALLRDVLAALEAS